MGCPASRWRRIARRSPDFDHIAAMTRRPTQWIVERGSDRPITSSRPAVIETGHRPKTRRRIIASDKPGPAHGGPYRALHSPVHRGADHRPARFTAATLRAAARRLGATCSDGCDTPCGSSAGCCCGARTARHTASTHIQRADRDRSRHRRPRRRDRPDPWVVVQRRSTQVNQTDAVDRPWCRRPGETPPGTLYSFQVLHETNPRSLQSSNSTPKGTGATCESLKIYPSIVHRPRRST